MTRDALMILVSAALTFLTRALPFLLFGRGGAPSATIRFIGRALPPAVIAILVIYSVRDVPALGLASMLPKAAGILATALMHLWRRNSLLSICAGTGAYMLLTRLLA